jgi:hypothetical protein
MKRLLFCLVALIAVMAMVAPTYAVEMNLNGISRTKFIGSNNMNGDDDVDDSRNFVHQRLRMYFTSVASENLKMVYKNEIDFNWGDNSFATGRSQGGRLGGDTVNLETKNVYLEMMIPDTPLKTTIGLQGVSLHRGWWISDDVSAVRFDMNFDPVTVLLAYVNAVDTNLTSSSDDLWQLHASAGYKAENIDARLSLGYERGPNAASGVANGTKEDNFYQVMGELGMSFDLVSFFVIAASNFGEKEGQGTQSDQDYKGYMFNAGVDFALDLATLGIEFIYASGDKEGDLDDDYRSFSGQTYSWAEICSDGYFWEANSNMPQISWEPNHPYPGSAASNHPSNMWTVAFHADLKPTDTTSVGFDAYYIGMVEDRTVGGNDEDTVGLEVNADLTQKVYDNLDVKVVGAYMFADDGYGTSATGSGDDAYVIGLGLNYKY